MKVLLILLFTSLISACSTIQPTKPKQLIDKEKMSVVLEEILLLESHFQSKFGVPGVYKDALDESATQVFKKHKVSKKQFQDSYAYYASKSEEFKELNTTIMDRLSRQTP